MKQTHDGGGAAALLCAVMVEALEETDPTIRERFVRILDKAYARVQHDDRYATEHDLEVLGWARQMVSGFSHRDGQQTPFLKG